MPRFGTALARSVAGEIGDWSRLEQMYASAHDGKLPKTREEVAWLDAQNARMRRIQAEQKAQREAMANG